MKQQTGLLHGSILAFGACILSLATVGCGADASVAGDGAESTTEQLTSCAPQVQPVVLASASSRQAAAFAPKYAIDGVTTTRWSSDKATEQWLELDLGKVVNVSGLNINWQTAYSKNYVVQQSADGLSWGTFIIAGATGSGVQSVSGAARTRYLRILSREATSWGNVSIIDVQVLGTLDSACANLLPGPWQFASEDFDPPTFDASTTYAIAGNSIVFTYQGKQFINTGRGNHFKQPVSVVQGGHYRLRLDDSNASGASATLFWATLSGAASSDTPVNIDTFNNPSGVIDFDVTSAPGPNPTITLTNSPISVFPGVGVQDFTVTATLTKTN
jgi:hypothetical protein